MPSLKLDRCCFFFDLRTGTLVLLWFLLILSTIASLAGVYKYTHMFTDGGIHSLEEFNDFLTNRPLIETGELPYWSYLALIFGIMPSTVALYGIFQRNSSCVLFYVIMNVFAIVSWIITVVTLILLLTFTNIGLFHRATKIKNSGLELDTEEYKFVIWKLIAFLVCSSVVNSYFTCVVYNYYLWMGRNRSDDAGVRS